MLLSITKFSPIHFLRVSLLGALSFYGFSPHTNAKRINQTNFMKKLLVLLSAFSFNLTAHAQKEYFVKATIVKNNGDALSGYIERVRDNQLAVGITFEPELKSKDKQQFTPDDLQSFTLAGENATYESVSYISYEKGKATPAKRFANLVLKGYCSLYKLELPDDEINIIFEPNNTHIFLVKKGDSVTVLKETEVMIGSSYSLNKDYVERLKILFRDCQDIDEDMIAATQFYKKALVKIFTTYNLCVRPGAQPQSFKTIKATKINPGVYLGYLFFNAKHVSSSSGFCAGFFVDLLKPSANERFAFSAGLEYITLKAEGEIVNPPPLGNYFEKDKLESFGLPLKGIYYLSKRKVAPFLSFGVKPAVISAEHVADNVFNSSVQKGWLVFGSFGPGLLIGRVYTEFLAEKEGIITTDRGTYYHIRLGVLF